MATVVNTKQSWLEKLFKIPSGQKLIWWMIEKQNNLGSQLLGLIGFIAVFWLAYRNPWGVVAMLLGMYIHELGHYLVFVFNKIKAVILLLFPLGAVAAPIDKTEDARSDQLPWWNIGWLLLAGPIMNLLLMAIGVVLISTNTLPSLGESMVLINGVLVVFNILPLWNMDGGQLFKVIFSSLKEKHDRVVALTGIVLSIGIIAIILLSPIGQGGIGVLLALLKNFGLITFLLFMAAGIWHKQGKDKPLHSKSKQAMTTRQVVIQLLTFFAVVTLTFYLFTL